MRLYGPILATLATLALCRGVPADTSPAPAGSTHTIARNATWQPRRSARRAASSVAMCCVQWMDGNLPAPIPGEDPHHKLQVMDGVLTLNSDGTYLCQTIVQTSYLGLVETEADTSRDNTRQLGRRLRSCFASRPRKSTPWPRPAPRSRGCTRSAEGYAAPSSCIRSKGSTAEQWVCPERSGRMAAGGDLRQVVTPVG